MRTWFKSLTLAFALSLLAAFSVSAQGGVTITVRQIDQSRFPQVDVYVSVTDASGNPVRNVQPGAFRLTEDGQPMALTAVTRSGEQGPVNTVLVIDHSGSMDYAAKMAGAKQAAATFVNQMRPGDRTALIQFDTEVDTLQPLTEDKAALLGAIQRIVPRGNTALYDALGRAAQYFETTQGRKAVIVVTDGMDNSSNLSREVVVDKASATGYSIYTIGLGNKAAGYGSQEGIDESILRELATTSYGAYYYRPDAGQLSDLYAQLSLLIQNEYKLTYTSANPLRSGLRRNIVVTAPGVATTEASYNPGGVIPEVEPQWSAWLLFFVALIVLVGLFYMPSGLRLAREHGLAMPMPSLVPPAPKKSRVKLTGGPTAAPVGGARSASAPTAARPPRIKIKPLPPSSDPTRSQLPWDEDSTKH